MGGFMGAVLRYLVSGYVQNMTQRIAFPYGTLEKAKVHICGSSPKGLID
jgi:fluoride ion exporter CrcB/FEX